MKNGTANSWWASKKMALTALGAAAISVLTYLAANDPNEQRRLCYGAAGVLITTLIRGHVSDEAKIDAAAAAPPTSPIVANQNNEPPMLVKPDEVTYTDKPV